MAVTHGVQKQTFRPDKPRSVLIHSSTSWTWKWRWSAYCRLQNHKLIRGLRQSTLNQCVPIFFKTCEKATLPTQRSFLKPLPGKKMMLSLISSSGHLSLFPCLSLAILKVSFLAQNTASYAIGQISKDKGTAFIRLQLLPLPTWSVCLT